MSTPSTRSAFPTVTGSPNGSRHWAFHPPSIIRSACTSNRCFPVSATGGATFPNRKEASREVLSLPMHPFLREADQDRVVAALAKVPQGMCWSLKAIHEPAAAARGRHERTMKPRIAVLGCGHWGKNLVRNFSALGHLEMVCDPAEAGRATATRIAPGVKISERFEDAVASPHVEAIAIAAPAIMHYSLAEGRPSRRAKTYSSRSRFAWTTAKARNWSSWRPKAGKVLMVGHLLQYHPCVLALHSLLATGDLGKLHYITSNRLNLGTNTARGKRLVELCAA